MVRPCSYLDLRMAEEHQRNAFLSSKWETEMMLNASFVPQQGILPGQRLRLAQGRPWGTRPRVLLSLGFLGNVNVKSGGQECPPYT